jgi:hypothetical protein
MIKTVEEWIKILMTTETAEVGALLLDALMHYPFKRPLEMNKYPTDEEERAHDQTQVHNFCVAFCQVGSFERSLNATTIEGESHG